jgi:hypothetical protein
MPGPVPGIRFLATADDTFRNSRSEKWSELMGSKESVRMHTDRVRAAKSVEHKLDALADAIDELTDFIDDLENQLSEIEEKVE